MNATLRRRIAHALAQALATMSLLRPNNPAANETSSTLMTQ